jgi:hypothetical protein
MKQKPKNVLIHRRQSQQGLEVIGAPGGFPQNAQVLSTITLAGAAFVFLKRHVQHPMAVVLNPPVPANLRVELAGAGLQTADVVPPLGTDFALFLAIDHLAR